MGGPRDKYHDLCWLYSEACNTSIPRVRSTRHSRGNAVGSLRSPPRHPSPGTPIYQYRPNRALHHFPHQGPTIPIEALRRDLNPPPLPEPPCFLSTASTQASLGKAAEEGARSPTRIRPPRNIPISNQGKDNEDWSIVRSITLLPLRRPSVNLNSLGGKIAELDQPELPAIPSLSTNDIRLR